MDDFWGIRPGMPGGANCAVGDSRLGMFLGGIDS